MRGDSSRPGRASGASTCGRNLRAGWRNRHWEVAVDVLNVFGKANNDIAYYYTSRLPGEAPEGVDDIHFHPAEPRTVRLSISRHF